MRFGEVDIGARKLEGAILAHTLRLKNGKGAIKKGVRLGARDIEALRDAGYARIMVAQLDAGDVHEDEAAARLAAVFTGPTIAASEARTGRCNLHATQAGVVTVEREPIDRANAISESITIATLAPHTLVLPNAMIATVKIIPFAVPASDVAQWETLLVRPDVLDVTPFRPFEAGLVLTTLPGMSPTLLERASRAQRARLGTLGSKVRREVRCGHSIDAVARAISTLREESCNPILLLGASAIVDRGDVIPSALQASGGRVTHLGMPVDPGNLLMVGELEGSTVFGLPGCARALTPSGFDQVLQRFFSGETVDSVLISGLGVGGLLKETKERPMPRNLGSSRGARKNVAGVVLAAGASRRMGRTNKLTLEIEGSPMVARVVDSLHQSGVREVLVVTGHAPEEIRKALGSRKAELVHNPNYEQGMGTSVSAGIAALGSDVDAAVVALGDMPWVGTDVIAQLIDAFTPDADLSIYVPMFGRKRGNPVLWAARHFPELEQLSGDVGGKALFHQHSEAICYVDVSSAAVNIDVDTPESLHQLGIDAGHRTD